MLADGTCASPTRRGSPGPRRADPPRGAGPEVARIFVHPGIKQALCRVAGGDRSWLAKVRPWWGHDSHFHVRLACPPGERLCRGQEAPPPGDGCGQDLAWWLGDEPWRPKPPGPPPKPVTLADLPAECAAVLGAEARRQAGQPIAARERVGDRRVRDVAVVGHEPVGAGCGSPARNR